jgi:phosphate:Na+ symporter
MGTIVLLDLMGGVALLLWGLHMVRTGILRAFGPQLRRFLSKALGNRIAAFLAGCALTAVLQSSTATGIMTASFAAEGLVALVPALAIMLGANVGTTLIVQLLAFNISAVALVLFIIGLMAFRTGGRSWVRDIGRAAIGLGLMLLALHVLLDTLAPAEEAPRFRNLLGAITGDPVLCVVIGAALTWAAHSSVATVLLVMSLAYSQFIPPAVAFALVLGANVGSAINPLVEGRRPNDLASYRLPAGNFLNRLVGVILFLPFLQPIVDLFRVFEPSEAKMTAEFHIAFNLAMAAAFIGVLDPVASLLIKVFPENSRPADLSAPRYLDESALETPSLALANAARETLRMGDFVETMLRQVMVAIRTNDRQLAVEVSRMDNIVDHLDEAIRLYLTKLTRGSLDEPEGHRAMQIISFAINLEHIGDIIDKNLCELALKKIKGNLQFSNEGAREIAAFHKQVLESLGLALVVFMSGDAVGAQALLSEKTRLRNAERSAAEHHLARLREGRPESMETTSLHLDVLRDLKRIHSHICSVAYPVLEAAGQLSAVPAPDRDEVSLPATEERPSEQ